MFLEWSSLSYEKANKIKNPVSEFFKKNLSIAEVPQGQDCVSPVPCCVPSS